MSICQNLNSIQEMSFIAGNTQYMQFECLDTDGLPIDITSSLVRVDFSPYGDTDYIALTKNGVISETNKFTIILDSDDTINLSGLYTFQPVITDIFSKDYRPLQGKIYIQSAIK